MDEEGETIDEALEGFAKAMAQQHEGMVFALVAICEMLIGKGSVTRDELTAHLRQVSAGLMEIGSAPLAQSPIDRLLSYLEPTETGSVRRGQ